MINQSDIDLVAHHNLHWYPNGQSALTGSLLTLANRLDKLFVKWASEFDAIEYSFPSLLPASELVKIDYFRSFPHLVTFAATPDLETRNLSRLAAASLLDNGAIPRTPMAPIRDVLTPAACYHFYVNLQNRNLAAPLYLTTRANCWRRETHYLPLQRQWCFSMREIVCIGSRAEVLHFLAVCRERVGQFLRRAALPIQWLPATDSFFNPAHNPKYVFQKIEPVKVEMTYRQRLALGSVNFHEDCFGGAFDISRAGATAYSGCVAFGIERWIYAVLSQFGGDEANWPSLAE